MINIVRSAAVAIFLIVGIAKASATDRPFGFRHGSERFVVVERVGNHLNRLTGEIIGPKRQGHVTVFEYLGEGHPLRKLYETDLVNDGVPLISMLSPDGRFYVTLDETHAVGTGPFTIVIYDLARKEYSTFSGKDFLSEEIIESLPPQGAFPGFKWYAKGFVFNRDSTKFYPTLPSDIDVERVPYVVIDLPTRTVRVEPVPSADPADIVPWGMSKVGWRASDEAIATDDSILPATITRTSPEGVEQVYELGPDKADYHPSGARTPPREKD